MANKGPTDKVSRPKPEAPKPAASRAAQNIYQPPKPKAAARVEAPKPAKPKAEAPRVKPEAPKAKPKDAPKPAAKAKPAEVKPKPAQAKAKPAEAKPKPAEAKAKPQEGILKRGMNAAIDVYKQYTQGDAKPQQKAKVEQVKPAKPAAKAEKPVPKAEKPVPKAEKPASKAEKPVPKAEKSVPKAEKPVPKAEKPQTANDKQGEKPRTQNEKSQQRGDKPQAKPDAPTNKAPESRFSLANFAGKVIDTGKKYLLPEPEKPHVNKVENADKLTPQQRKQQGVTDYVNPKTGDKYNYDNEGRLKQVETKNKLKTSYEYKNGQPANVSRTQKILFWEASVGSAEAIPGKVDLKVDQHSGEARTSRHGVIQQRDAETKKVKNVEVKQEMVFHTNGTKSAITSDLNGRRMQKEHLSTDDKTTAITTYQYNESKPGRGDGPVRAQQTDSSGRVVHKIDFANEKDLKQQKAAAREDIKYERKGAIESEHHETFDLRSGKEVLVNKTDKTTDYKQGHTTVREQQFDKGKLAIDQTVKFDERSRAVEMKYKDVQKNVDVSVKFDEKGNSTDVKGNYKNYTDDQSVMKTFVDSQVGRVMATHEVKTIDAGEMLRYCERSNPREGEKPTGVIAWQSPGESTLTQGTVVDGIVYDAQKNKLGTINDRGDLTLTSGQKFNVINDKQYAAMFHGVGSDDHPLNLYGTEGMNGYISSQGDRMLMVGGNMIDADGKIIGRMNGDGRMIFAQGVHQDAGTDIKSYLHGGYIFKGNENGNERRFFVDSISNGQMYVQQTDKNGNQILDANGKPVKPIDCEMRLGMVIDKNTGKQLYNFVPPDVNNDETFSGGYMISMGDSPKMTALADMKGASFNVTVLGNQNTYKLVGIATGPQQFQADGTPVRGSGGVVNLERELKLEQKNFETRTGALNARLDEERNLRMKGALMSPLNPAGGIALADAYNEATGGAAQTAAERTAFDLAKKHYDDQTSEINRIMTTGQIDNNTLYKLQTGNEKIRQSQLDQLERMKLLIDNPEHKLETVTAKSVDGTIKRPDLNNPGKIVDYEVRNNLIYKKGSTNAIGHVNAQDGTMKMYDASGRVEITKMNDRRLAGTVFHLEGVGENGQKQSVDWLTDGTGKIQSFAEMRKQAADQRKYFEVLAGDSGSSQRAKDGLARTIHNEQRFNNTLDNMLKNGVRDVTIDQQGRINPGYDLGKIIEGPKRNIQAEDFQKEERVPPKKVNVHSFQSQEDCTKASGTMRVGKDLYYVEKGALYQAKTENGKTVPVGNPIGSLEPGYVAEINGKRISLQNESQFLFQFKLDGDSAEHRIFGTGPAHIDQTGRFVKGGLVDARELLVGGAEAKIAANQAMQEYFAEKPGGNFIADGLGWAVNTGLGDREGQMRYVNETLANQNSAMKTQLDLMFNQGLSENGLTNNQVDHGVNTANRFMRDLNMSAADMDQLSMEGRNIQKQTSESVAMAMMSLVPGGVTLAAGRAGAGSLLATSGVARLGVATIAGGGISVATRQSEKVDWSTAFGTGMVEGGAMFIGAEGSQLIEKLKHVNAASKLGTMETVAALGSKELQPLLKSPFGKTMVEIALKPNGDKVLEGMWRVANAGFQTTALTGASSLREGNFDMMTPSKLLEGGAFMLGADLVTMLAKVPTPGLEWKLDGKVGRFIDGNIKQLAEDSVNNVSNTLMSARVQANEVELENIARERGIPKDLISREQFEKWKNQSRINAFLVQSVTESVASSLVSAPMNHAMHSAMQHGGGRVDSHPDAKTQIDGTAPRLDTTVIDGTPRTEPILDTAGSDRLPRAEAPRSESDNTIETSFGHTKISPDGKDVEVALHSGGTYRYNFEDGRIGHIKDANGKETTLTYDTKGDVTAMRVQSGEHTATWTKQGDGWLVRDSSGIEIRSTEKISVTPDGRVIHQSDDTRTVVNLDGSTLLSDGKGGPERVVNPNLNEDLRLNQVIKLIEHNVSDDVLASRIQANIGHLMERIIVTGKDRAELAKTLMHVSDLLQDNPMAKLDKTTRHRLAEEALWLAANPTYLNQGRHPTCAIAAAEVRQYMERPSEVIRAISEIAATGEYRCPDGTILQPFHAGGEWIFAPDTDAKVPYQIQKPSSTAETFDRPRLMASQIWQTLAVTAFYAPMGYTGHPSNGKSIGYHNDFVSDMTTNPPTRLMENDGPNLKAGDLLSAVRQLYGDTENFALVNAVHEQGNGSHTFKDQRGFTEQLLNIDKAGKFPVVFVIDTRNPPWNHANGDVHAISILGIDKNVAPHDPRKISDIFPGDDTMDDAGQRKLPSLKDITVRIDNQWGKKVDWKMQTINAEELFLASFRKDDAKASTRPRADEANQKPDDWREYGPDQSEKFHIRPHDASNPTDIVEIRGINDRETLIERTLQQQVDEANRRLRSQKEPDLRIDKLDAPTKEDGNSAKKQTTQYSEESHQSQSETPNEPAVKQSKMERAVELSKMLGDQNLTPEQRNALQLEHAKVLREYFDEAKSVEGSDGSERRPRSEGSGDGAKRSGSKDYLEPSPLLAPEPYFAKVEEAHAKAQNKPDAAHARTSDAKVSDSQRYKTGEYKEPSIFDGNDKAMAALRKSVDFEHQAWYQDKNLRNFNNEMLKAFSEFEGKSETQKVEILQAAIQRFMNDQGLPSPTILVSDAKTREHGAEAMYAFADGKLHLKSTFFNSGGDVDKNLSTLIHELTHTMQDFQIIRLAKIEAIRAADGKSVNIGDIMQQYNKLQGRKLDITGGAADWFIAADKALRQPPNSDYVESKARLSKTAYNADVDTIIAKELSHSRSAEGDKNSAERQARLIDRSRKLVSMLVGAGEIADPKDLRRYVENLLSGSPHYSNHANKPIALLQELRGDKGRELRTALFGYDPLHEKFTRRNANGQENTSTTLNHDQLLEAKFNDPTFFENNPDFLKHAIGMSKFFWEKSWNKAFPEAGFPEGHKSSTRMQFKAMMKAYDHFYPPEGGQRHDPIGKLTKAEFDREIGRALGNHLIEHLAFNKDQAHRMYFGTRYELQPRVASERLEQLRKFGDTKSAVEADLHKELQELAKLRQSVMEDKLVKGTLSEFGFEVKLKQIIDRPKQPVIVGFIDLNNFKHVNTNFSQDAGDEALRVFGAEAANVLKKYGLTPSECLGHFGGDEYGIVLNGKSISEAKKIFREIQSLRICCEAAGDGEKGVDRPCQFRVIPDGTKSPEDAVVVTATLGAVVRKKGQSAEDVLQSADKVMFVVKDKVKQLPPDVSLTKVNAFARNVELVRGAKDSNQLVMHRSLDEFSTDFKLRGKTVEEVRKYLESRVDETKKFLSDMVLKHRHTGIWGKQHSKDFLQEQIDKKEPFSILRLSVDNFKPVNDVFESHAKGNAVLKEVGSYLLDLKQRHGDDIEFLGSLGGPAPFMIIKDADKAEQIRQEVDKFFLRVSKQNEKSERINSHTEADKERGEIPVGFSAAAMRFDPASGLDAEGLLVASKVFLEKVERDHISENRHTQRAGDHKASSEQEPSNYRTRLRRRAADRRSR